MPALAVSSIRPLGVDTDTESILGTLRRRWWVVPIVFAVVGGLVLLQDPETSVQPRNFRVDRDYQVIDNTAALALLDLPDDLLAPLPSLDIQLAQLSSSSEYRMLTEQFLEVSLSVRLAENVVTLRGRVAPVINVACTESVPRSCPAALDGLAALIQARHETALREGLTQLLATVASLESGITESPILGQRLDAIESAINALQSQSLTQLFFIREDNAEESVTTLADSLNYRFAIAASLILSLLIMLQWSVLDKRLYGLQRIARTVGVEQVIGHVPDPSRESDVVASASSLRRLATGTSGLRVVRLTGVDESLLELIASRSDVPASSIGVDQINGELLADTATPSVIVAQRGRSSAVELAKVSDALAMSTGKRPSVLLLG